MLLSRPKKTIYAELNRNSVNGMYIPAYAQQQYMKRRSEINKGRRKLKHYPEMIHIIKSRLKTDKRMPDSIAGYMKLHGIPFVSTQTMYNYINEYDPQLKQYLKYKRGYQKKPSMTGKNMKQGFTSIEQRLKIIEDRSRIGDRGVDTVVSSGTQRKGGCVTMVERNTKFIVGGIVQYKTMQAVADIIIREGRNMPNKKLLTITAHNGKEFNDFKRIEKKLYIQTYFAHPYFSYERGTNEQTNGMLRVFYPKGTDFTRVNEKEFQKVLGIINRKPRKSLGYLCAYEKFYGVRLHL